ncbi:MAG: serine/threonine protein kinase [Anaerolineae bacterium]|jgi:serine/threonine protein kinase|nr:serine/threonine protein kinase [Anaerolineae bacterium]
MTLPASTIGPYEIIAQVGSGGMATVYKARQPKLDRFVAVKVMHRLFLSDHSFLNRFEREARIVAQLDHANVVPIYDYDQHDGVPYLVMKYIEGRTLKDKMTAGALTLDEILQILTAVASALTYAHGRGILHRDIKPSNILLDEHDTPYLTDFGLARIAQAGSSTLSADMMLGTPHYISPEQAQGTVDLDARTDIYALGVVLYEMVVGGLPFTGDTPYIIVHKHIYEQPPAPSQLNPEIPPAIDAVLLKALSKNPEDRYETATALAAAFREAVQTSGLTELDAKRHERTQILPKAAPAVSPPPVQRKEKANDGRINIPTATPDVQPKGGQVTFEINNDTLKEVADRFRMAIDDIRQQVQNREFGQKFKETAEKAFIEIKAQIDEAQQQRGTPSPIRVRKAHTLLRDWSMDEKSVGRRVSQRVERNREFIGHSFTFVFLSALLIAFNPTYAAFVAEEFGEFAILASLPVVIGVLVMWFGGVISHGVSVFYNTGQRYDQKRQMIAEQMELRYGPDWVDTVEDAQYRPVSRSVQRGFERRVSFWQHVTSGLATAFGVAMIFPMLYPEFLPGLMGDAIRFLPEQSHVIFFVLMLISIVIHGAQMLLSPILGEEAKQRATQREIEREHSLSISTRKTKNTEKAKNDPMYDQVVRLTDDGEFTESMIQSMDDASRRKK